MIKECIKTAPTIEEAKQAALLELGLSEMDLYNVEVLKVPEKKILGLFGGSPAEVKVTVEVADEKPAEKVSATEKTKTNSQEKPAQKSTKKPQPKAEKVEAEEVTEERKESLKPTDEYNSTANYIREIILGLGMEKCEVKVFSDDEEICFELDCGDDYGLVIGRNA